MKKKLIRFCFFSGILFWNVLSYASFSTSQSIGEQRLETVIEVLDINEMNIMDAIKVLSQKGELNIVATQQVKGEVTVYLRDVLPSEALKIILDINGWVYKEEDGIIKVMTPKEYASKYGSKFRRSMEMRNVKVAWKNVPKIVSALNKIKSNEGEIIVDQGTGEIFLIEESLLIDEMERIIENLDVSIETKIFSLNYASAQEIGSKIQELLSPEIGSVNFDERSNILIITDTSYRLHELSRIVSAFDKKDKEVFIEAKIVQVVLSDDNKYGVDWQGLVKDYHDLKLIGNFDVLNLSQKRSQVSVGTLSEDNYSFLIQALEQSGESNILSSPHITAINKEEAKILVGSSEPYVTTTTTTPSSGSIVIAEEVNFIEVGVKLFVVPTIHNDGYITMKIKPEVSSVVSNLVTSNNNILPIVETSVVETTVSVKDGVTIVIGGLIKDEIISSQKKIPVLGDVPVLGAVFRNTADLKKKTEILIFLTPRIISGDVI